MKIGSDCARMERWMQFSMKFRGKEMESAFVQSRSRALFSRSRLTSACIFLALVFLMLLRLFFYKPWTETNDDMMTLQWSYTVVWGLGVCGCLMLLFSRAFVRLLHPITQETVAVIAICFLLLSCFASQHYLAAAHGIKLQEDTCVFEGDGFITLPLAVALGLTHMLLPIRWIMMLASQVLCLLLYVGVSLTLGFHTGVAIFNSILLSLFVLCISLGKRQLELTERRFFLTLINERRLRANAELELSKYLVDQRPLTAPSIESASWFRDLGEDVTTQLDTVRQMGRREQWLIEEEALQVAPILIGSGSYGLVLLGKFRKSPVAVKVLKMYNRRTLASIGSELRIHRRLRHSNIVQFYGSCVSESVGEIALVLELSTGVTLQCFVGSLDASNSNASRLQCLLGICRALLYLHTRSPVIVHGDLKTSNVLVETRVCQGGQRVAHARLLDFGLSRAVTQDSKNLGGTLRWAAPEAFDAASPRPSADVYSFGLLFFFIATSDLPHKQLAGEQFRHLASLKRLPPLQWTLSTPFLESCKAVVNTAICIDPDQRSDISDINDDLVGIMRHVADVNNVIDFDCIDGDFWPTVRHLRQPTNTLRSEDVRQMDTGDEGKCGMRKLGVVRMAL